jgi:hypothetical protein
MQIMGNLNCMKPTKSPVKFPGSYSTGSFISGSLQQARSVIQADQ